MENLKEIKQIKKKENLQDYIEDVPNSSELNHESSISFLIDINIPDEFEIKKYNNSELQKFSLNETKKRSLNELDLASKKIKN
jgi:hypothetical protein